MKKDIFQHDIEVGDYIIYMISASARHFEKAIVIQSEYDFIKIEYLGVSSNDSSWRKKDKGKKSRLTETESKIIIINAEPSDEKNVYIDGKKRFDDALKKVKRELMATIKRETDLLKENKELRVEVNKIHDRFDILDL
jgi:hypothetical protein